MKNLIPLLSILVFVISCQKENEIPPSEIIENWNPVFSEIDEEILDAKVNGEELHLISDKYFYRINGEEIIEKRELESSNYLNYSAPQIGKQLIFRLLNFDSILFLEFQPIAEGGLTSRIDIQSMGVDDLTFPTTHGLGTINVGRFDSENNFIFTGHDYPSGQQFIVEIKIDYNEAANIIESIEIQNRLEITPIYSALNTVSEIDDVIGVENITFINAGLAGTYRFENGEIQYFEDINLKSVFVDGQDYYGALAGIDRSISKSSDEGLSWINTGISLNAGQILIKKGEYFIETNKWDQIFRIGKSIEQMDSFDTSQFDKDYIHAKVEFYNGNYLLIGYIDSKYQILSRPKLD